MTGATSSSLLLMTAILLMKKNSWRTCIIQSRIVDVCRIGATKIAVIHPPQQSN